MDFFSLVIITWLRRELDAMIARTGREMGLIT
jgi:hypothetical protein